MGVETNWTDRQALPAQPGDNHAPAAVYAGNVLHVVWTSKAALFYTALADNTWSAPVRIASGEQPALAAGPNGELHCVFTSWAAGSAEVYHMRWERGYWSPHQLVSRTTGLSISPAIAVGPDSKLHAAWADNSPGRLVVYYGQPTSTGWNTMQVPHAEGSRPALAIGPNGEAHLAWQNRDAGSGRYEVYASVFAEGRWSLPDNVSATPGLHSINPRLAANKSGRCHMVWQEEDGPVFVVRHADRRPNGWSQPALVSTPGVDCRQPEIVANAHGLMQVMWAEGATLRHRIRSAEYDAPWLDMEAAGENYPSLSDLAVALAPDGELHAVWSGFDGSDTRALYHVSRAPAFKQTLHFPVIGV